MSDRLDWLKAHEGRLLLGHRNTAIMTVTCQEGLFSDHGEWFEDGYLESFYQGFMACKSLMFSEQVEMAKQAYEQLQPTVMDIH